MWLFLHNNILNLGTKQSAHNVAAVSIQDGVLFLSFVENNFSSFQLTFKAGEKCFHFFFSRQTVNN